MTTNGYEIEISGVRHADFVPKGLQGFLATMLALAELPLRKYEFQLVKAVEPSPRLTRDKWNSFKLMNEGTSISFRVQCGGTDSAREVLLFLPRRAPDFDLAPDEILERFTAILQANGEDSREHTPSPRPSSSAPSAVPASSVEDEELKHLLAAERRQQEALGRAHEEMRSAEESLTLNDRALEERRQEVVRIEQELTAARSRLEAVEEDRGILTTLRSEANDRMQSAEQALKGIRAQKLSRLAAYATEKLGIPAEQIAEFIKLG